MDKITIISLLILSGTVNAFFLIVSIYCSRLSKEAIEREKVAKKETENLRKEVEKLSKKEDPRFKIIATEVESLPVITLKASRYYPIWDWDALKEAPEGVMDKQIKEDMLWAMRDGLASAITIKDIYKDPQTFANKVYAEIKVVGNND